MPESHVATLNDPSEFGALSAARRDVDAELLVTAKGEFRAEVTMIDLPRLWISRLSEPLPAILRVTVPSNRAFIAFPTTAAQGTIHNNGAELSAGSLLIFGRASTNYVRVSGPLLSANMSLRHEDLAAVGKAIAGVDLAAPADSKIIRPPPAAIARLSALHEAVGQLTKTAPKFLTNAEVARALEQELIEAMVACLADRSATPRAGASQHNRVMARLEDFLATRQYEPVYLAEICAAIGVSERTLRTCCHDHLGIGPVRYLWLRRMNLAHSALLRADASQTTVTAVATDHGFWELGRFSVEYRALFGESPSTSLQRPPQDSWRRAIAWH